MQRKSILTLWGALFTVVTGFSHSAVAFDEVTLISRNPSFEEGTTGWNNTQLQSEILTRNWTPSYTTGGGFFEGNGELGAKLVRLRGVGAWGQNISFNSTSRHHIFNAHAFKKSTTGPGAGGFACVAISYYDANWKELDKVTIPIDGADTSLQRGIGDGLNFYSWGIEVPAGAKNVYMFAYTTAGTEIYLDRMSLFEYRFGPISPRFASNIVANNLFGTFYTFGPNPCLAYGSEFWETDFDWSRYRDGTLGSPSQPEWAYQFVPVKPGSTYTLLGTGYKFANASVPAGFGIDLYDASWKKVGQSSVDLAGVESFIGGTDFPVRGRRITIPTNVAHASVWIWADRFPAPVASYLSCRLELLEQESAIGNNTSITLYRTFVSGGKAGATGASFFVIYSDADGMDLTSIDTQDGSFVNSTNPSITYPISTVSKESIDGDKLVIVNYSYSSTTPSADTLILKANQVKDKKGNFVPAKSITSR